MTEMTPGLTRKAATVELTRDPATFEPSTSSPISAVAMSPNGRYLAVTTVRTKFTLDALRLLSPIRAVPDVRELYVIDTEEGTIERVTGSIGGGDIDGDVLDGATISADGDRVAFASFAGDLFFGDANQRADAFVATRPPETGPGTGDESPGEGGPDATIEVDNGPRIAVRAVAKSHGVVLLTVFVPAAGGVKATARARAGRPRKVRTLGTATARAEGGRPTSVRLVLRTVARYQGELRVRGSIPARMSVNYVASQGGRRASAFRSIRFFESSPSGRRPRMARK
jgi:hypothetical protein